MGEEGCDQKRVILRGREKVGWLFTLAAGAYNLVKMRPDGFDGLKGGRQVRTWPDGNAVGRRARIRQISFKTIRRDRNQKADQPFLDDNSFSHLSDKQSKPLLQPFWH